MGLESRGHSLGKPVAIHRERAARGHLVGVSRAHHQRAEPAHLLVEEADRIVVAVVGAERVRAHELGEAAGLVDRGGAQRAHLVQHHGNAPGGDLPSGFAPGQPAADDMDGLHRTRGYWKTIRSQPQDRADASGHPGGTACSYSPA